MCVVCLSLFVVRCLMFVGCRLLCVLSSSVVDVGCCVLFVVVCLLFVFVVSYCLLFVVC